MALASPPSVSQPLTLEAYLQEGELLARYDILDGVRVYTMPSPTLAHQEIAGNVYEVLRAHGRATGSGRAVMAPFDVVISRDPLRTRQPDVLFISAERLEEAGGVHLASPLTVGPELVVEVLSESDTRRSRLAKLADYCKVGVIECWLVSPEAESVEVLRLSAGGAESLALVGVEGTLKSTAITGLECPAARIFEY